MSCSTPVCAPICTTRRLLRRNVALVLVVSVVGFCFGASAQNSQPAPTVVLENFKFQPRKIELRASVPVILRLENRSSGGHSFVAPAFFAEAKIDPASAGLINNGRVEVPSHQTIELNLVPAAGVYSLKCGHVAHAMFGMTGTIVVR